MRNSRAAWAAALFSLIALFAGAHHTLAQGPDMSNPFGPLVGTGGPKPSPTPAKAPTIITADEDVIFNQKTRTAVFDVNVRVKDPEYIITSDKLTAILKKEAVPGASPVPKPAATPGADPKEGPQEGNNLEKATAEGHVIIIQDKIDSKTGKVEHYIGKSEKAVYDGATGDITLTGWPQIQQGGNTHVSLAESTVMIVNRSGTIRTHGPSKTLLQQEPDSPTPAPSPR